MTALINSLVDCSASAICSGMFFELFILRIQAVEEAIAVPMNYASMQSIRFIPRIGVSVYNTGTLYQQKRREMQVFEHPHSPNPNAD